MQGMQVQSLCQDDLLEKEMANHSRASLVSQRVKNLLAVWEIRVQSLCWEDPLEKGMGTHSSILAWEMSWTEDPGGLQSIGSRKDSDTA